MRGNHWLKLAIIGYLEKLIQTNRADKLKFCRGLWIFSSILLAVAVSYKAACFYINSSSRSKRRPVIESSLEIKDSIDNTTRKIRNYLQNSRTEDLVLKFELFFEIHSFLVLCTMSLLSVSISASLHSLFSLPYHNVFSCLSSLELTNLNTNLISGVSTESAQDGRRVATLQTYE